MATADPRPFDVEYIENPNQSELRSLALEHTPCVQRTAAGSINKVTRNKARMAKYTYIIDTEDRWSHQIIEPEKARELIARQAKYIADKGLWDEYYRKTQWYPHQEWIFEQVEECEDVVLLLGFWVEEGRMTPLYGSLDPMDAAHLLADLPQRHLSGAAQPRARDDLLSPPGCSVPPRVPRLARNRRRPGAPGSSARNAA